MTSLVQMLLSSGLILLVAWLLTRWVKQPALQQRIGEYGIVGAFLVALLIPFGFHWWSLPTLPSWSSSPVPTVSRIEKPVEPITPPLVAPRELEVRQLPKLFEIEPVPEPAPVAPVVPKSPVDIERSEEATSSIYWWLVVYLLGSVWFLARFAWAQIALRGLIRRSSPLSSELRQQLESLVSLPSKTRVLVSDEISSPLSCGLFRPTIVIPGLMCRSDNQELLRWVLIHEQTHLQRRDAWGTLYFGLGQIVYYLFPWFWWLKRHTALCQEYIADSLAAEQTGAREEYAQFLLSWKSTPTVPVGATGIFSSVSDLFRRISMLLNEEKIQPRCSRRWSMILGAGAVALAVLLAGTGFQAQAETKTGEQFVADEKAPKAPPRQPGLNPLIPPDMMLPPAFDRLFDLFPLPGVTQDQLREVRERFKELNEQMRQMRMGGLRRGIPNVPNRGIFPRFPQVPGIGQPTAPATNEEKILLGIRVGAPAAAMVDQLDLPKGQGLVIAEINPGSTAEKLGLKTHDILLEIDGKAVPNDPAQLGGFLEKVEREKAVDVVVLRKGKNETLKGLKLPKTEKAKNKVEAPRDNAFPNFRGLQIPDFGNLQIPGFGGANSSSTSMSIGPDGFKSHHKSGNVTIDVVGSMENGQPKIDTITVKEGKDSHTYKKLEDVPAQHRARVKSMMPNQKASGLRFGAPKLIQEN